MSQPEKNIVQKINIHKIYVSSYRAGVAPAAAVSVKAAGPPGHAGGGRQRSALSIIEGHIIYSDVATGPRRAPDTLNDHLEITNCQYKCKILRV